MVREIPAGYMDQNYRLMAIIHFSTTSIAMEWNWQVILFGVHNSHYNADFFYIMVSKFIHTLVLKSGDINNDHPNDNG